jgi:hypothetical protein
VFEKSMGDGLLDLENAIDDFTCICLNLIAEPFVFVFSKLTASNKSDH